MHINIITYWDASLNLLVCYKNYNSSIYLIQAENLYKLNVPEVLDVLFKSTTTVYISVYLRQSVSTITLS